MEVGAWDNQDEDNREKLNILFHSVLDDKIGKMDSVE